MSQVREQEFGATAFRVCGIVERLDKRGQRSSRRRILWCLRRSARPGSVLASGLMPMAAELPASTLLIFCGFYSGACLRTIVGFVIPFLVIASFSFAETEPQLNLMPMPASVQLANGQLLVSRSFSVSITGQPGPRLNVTVQLFLDDLAKQTALPRLGLKITSGANANLVINVEHEGEGLPQLGEEESYALEVTANGAKLNAATVLGVMCGLQTFLQLVQTGTDGFFVPALTIHDQPRFPWRGLMIDCAATSCPSR